MRRPCAVAGETEGAEEHWAFGRAWVAVLFPGLICLCQVEGGAQGDISTQTHTVLLGIHFGYSLTCSLCLRGGFSLVKSTYARIKQISLLHT